jgi:hypothetical protein
MERTVPETQEFFTVEENLARTPNELASLVSDEVEDVVDAAEEKMDKSGKDVDEMEEDVGEDETEEEMPKHTPLLDVFNQLQAARVLETINKDLPKALDAIEEAVECLEMLLY